MAQLDSLHQWLDHSHLADDDIIARYVEAMEQVLAQDTEQDEHGRVRIIRGVAEDRRVSIEDPQMRLVSNVQAHARCRPRSSNAA